MDRPLHSPRVTSTVGSMNAPLTPAPRTPSTTDRRRSRLDRVDAWWRAANYLAVGQIYLLDNPLLHEPLAAEHVKPRLLGHWGTTPGLNFVWAHLNRIIVERRQEVLFVTGPGHGGPAVVAQAWMEGTYSEVYPAVGQDVDGLRALMRQFSFPGGIPSHAAPETPGSMNEGGELGYSLAHAYGAAFDNPDLLVACVIGDGEAETGALAASWHSTAFLNPRTDGAVLPVLHLNGWKIANPTVLARMPQEQLVSLLTGYGFRPYLFTADADEDHAEVHARMAEMLDQVLDEIGRLQHEARSHHGPVTPPAWPVIVLRTPKGWTGPDVVDHQQVEGTFRSHQVPLVDTRTDAGHRARLEEWMRSYRPEELFDHEGRLLADLDDLCPVGDLRMSASPHANGGHVRRPLVLPDLDDHAVPVTIPGAQDHSPTGALGGWVRDVIRANPRTFLMTSPDETASNRLQAVFEVTSRRWLGRTTDDDVALGQDGRVLEILSEHLCQGWLEGYTLTGRHGIFNCYEAFVHIVDSMVNQHAKWLQNSKRLDWRPPVSSLNYLLSSHVWRQDHNGFSHQDPGFIDHVVNNKADVVRVYLPPDVNTLLQTMDHCLRTTDTVNVVVAGKNPMPAWLGPHQAAEHCRRGLGVWEWAGHLDDGEPDVVLGCAGDVPTLEVLAAAQLLRDHLPDLRVRVVNVVDLMRLQDEREHPHGMSDTDFDAAFTTSAPVIFAYHGYPTLIHRLTYRRTNHQNLHVRGYKEEGTTTTPFDMVRLNDLDRFGLVRDVIDRVPGLADRAGHVRSEMGRLRDDAVRWTREHGEDAPGIRDWRWRG